MLEPAMNVIISLLRGVNLGSHHKIKMDALRVLYESLKLRDPQTYVQSGNVIFRTGERDLVLLARRIEEAIERKFGFRSDVILRSASELKGVVRRNPFAARRDIEPGKLLVTFLPRDPGPEMRAEVCRIKAEAEEVRIGDRELYIYYPDGMGRSKLARAIEKALKKSGTARNWNTVTKLLEIAERLEASG